MGAPARPWQSPVLWGLVLGVAIAAGLASCSARAAHSPNYAAMDLRKKEISDLWLQIRQWRVQAGMKTEPIVDVKDPALQMAVPQIRTCSEPQPTTDSCQDTCSLKDAICDNADSICRIAGELAGDAWADEKCQNAKASCKEATQRCCECAASEKSAPAAAPADMDRKAH